MKKEERSYLKEVPNTGTMAEVRDALKDSPVGQAVDIRDRIIFLMNQFILTLQNIPGFDKENPEAFSEAATNVLIRLRESRNKMENLLLQMPSQEACEQDMERIMAIVEELIPGSRDKIIERMEKREEENLTKKGGEKDEA
jgi:hypothetical protein